MRLKELLKSKIFRTDQVISYSGLRTREPETLSHHIIEVQLLSLKMYYELLELGYNELELGQLLYKGLLHDMDEVITGDFPRPIKYYNKEIRDSIEFVADKSVQLLSYNEFGSMEPYKVWSTSKSGHAGLVIKVSDLAVVAKKAAEEVLIFGNNEYLKVLDEVKGYMIETKSVLLSMNNDKLVEYLIDFINLLISDLNEINIDQSLLELVSYKDYIKQGE